MDKNKWDSLITGEEEKFIMMNEMTTIKQEWMNERLSLLFVKKTQEVYQKTKINQN